MRIGFDISAQSLPRSGVGQYQYQLLKALLKLDTENQYNLHAFNFRNRERFKQIGFPSNNYNLKVIPIPQRVMIAWWHMFGFPKLQTVVGKCDIFQVSELCIPPVKNAKSVAFVHDLTTLIFPEYHVKSNVFLHKERFKRLNKVDGVLTNSEFTKSDLVKRLKMNPDNIFVTPLGADKMFRPMERHEFADTLSAFKLKKPYILFVGTLEPRKNIKTLIQAFNRLKMKRSIPHELILVGMEGWKYEEIMEEIELSPVRTDIRRIGYVNDADVPALLNGADVFVYPSFYEGFGLPILEAMQCGTPVITSNVSALPETGGDACLYVEPKSIDQLTKTMENIIHNRHLQNLLSEKGILRAKAFSWKKCAKLTLDAYNSVLDN